MNIPNIFQIYPINYNKRIRLRTSSRFRDYTYLGYSIYVRMPVLVVVFVRRNPHSRCCGL